MSTKPARRKRITVTVGEKYPCHYVPSTTIRSLMHPEQHEADVEFSLISDQYAQDEYSGIRMVFLEKGKNTVLGVVECRSKKHIQQLADQHGDILIKFDETFDRID